MIGAVVAPHGGVRAVRHEAGRVPGRECQRLDLTQIAVGKIQHQQILVAIARIDDLVVAMDELALCLHLRVELEEQLDAVGYSSSLRGQARERGKKSVPVKKSRGTASEG